MNKENEVRTGNIVISGEVVSKIIKTAALETEGVAYISCPATAIRGMLSKKSVKGVGFRTENDSIEASVGIAVCSGYDAVEIAHRVQSKVSDNIESMTGYRCANVDVDVIDIVVKDNTITEVE